MQSQKVYYDPVIFSGMVNTYLLWGEVHWYVT